MTAITKRQKRLSRRGRKRLPDLERTPEGRISRSNEQNEKRESEKAADVMATVIDMRQRLHGATGENVKDPAWGYALGRIWLDGNLGRGELGRLRLEAGNRYASDLARYYGLTGIPFPSARAQSLFSVGGHDGEISESRADAARKASNRMMTLEGALLKCKDGRNAATTVKNVCLLDIEEARGWPSHMLDFLRSGLDALVWQYGLIGER